MLKISRTYPTRNSDSRTKFCRCRLPIGANFAERRNSISWVGRLLPCRHNHSFRLLKKCHSYRAQSQKREDKNRISRRIFPPRQRNFGVYNAPQTSNRLPATHYLKPRKKASLLAHYIRPRLFVKRLIKNVLHRACGTPIQHCEYLPISRKKNPTPSCEGAGYYAIGHIRKRLFKAYLELPLEVTCLDFCPPSPKR